MFYDYLSISERDNDILNVNLKLHIKFSEVKYEKSGNDDDEEEGDFDASFYISHNLQCFFRFVLDLVCVYVLQFHICSMKKIQMY